MKYYNLLIPKNKKYINIFYIVIILITLILMLGVANLDTNNDITVLLPVNEDTQFEREKISRLSKEFYTEQFLFVGVSGDPFTMDKIQKLWKLCRDIESLKVVRSTYNPFNSTYFKKTGDVFVPIKMSMFSYPKTEEELETFIKNISSNRFMVGSVITFDKKSAGIVVKANNNALMGKEIDRNNIFVKSYEFLFNKKLGPKKIDKTYFCNEVENVLKKYEKDFKIYMAGVPLYEAKSKTYMQRDIFILIIPVMFIMALVFYLSFRTKRGTFLPFLAILLSIGWTMGIIGWARYKLDTVAIVIPPIIMTVCSSYALHYMNSFYNHLHLYKRKEEMIFETTKSILPTIFFAAITTIAGFASFLTAKILSIRFFGFWIVISIFLSLFFTFFLLPKILYQLKEPKDYDFHKKVKKDFFARVLSGISTLIYPFRYLWVLIFLVSIALSFIFIPKIKIEMNAAKLFKKNDKVTDGLIFLEKQFKGTTSYNITIRSVENKRNFFKSYEGLLAAKKIQDYIDNGVTLGGNNMIGWNFSPVTIVQDLNFAMDGTYDIPKDEKMIKKFFNILTAYRDDSIKSIINNDFSAITFQVRMHTDNKKELILSEQDLEKLNEILNKDLTRIANDDGRFSVEIWGETLLFSKISKYLVYDQVLNLTSTALIVLLLTLILFRSPYYAFISIISLAFGVLMNFVIMGMFGIALNTATVMIAAISIGIGVDNSIHYILHYRKALIKTKDTRKAIQAAFEYTSRPILFTSLALIFGFLVFVLSSFKPIMFFGVLISITIVNCMFATLFILPSFLIITEKVRLFFHKK